MDYARLRELLEPLVTSLKDAGTYLNEQGMLRASLRRWRSAEKQAG